MMFKKEEIFAIEEVNTGRQKELDFAKMILVIGLAIVHCYVECSDEEAIWHGLPYFFDSVVGGPFGAPVFIFCMGIGLAYTVGKTPRTLALRGVRLFLCGMLLNIFRYVIPALVGYAITGDEEQYLESFWYNTLGSDILTFAGLALLLMAALIRIGLSLRQIWIVGLVMSLSTILLNKIVFHSIPLAILAGHFIGVDKGPANLITDFPLLCWFLMLASGNVYGVMLRKMKDKAKFYMIVSPICILICLIVLPVEYIFRFGMMGGPGDNVFYHITTPELFVSIAANLSVMGVGFVIASHLPRKAMDFVTEVSRSVTTVYCIQWVLVWWAADVVLYIARGTTYMDSLPTLLLGIALTIVANVVGDIWARRRREQMARRKQPAQGE